MGFLTRINNTLKPHRPQVGDVYQSPMGDLVMLVGHKLTNETVFWVPEKGIRTLNHKQFLRSFGRVQRRDDNSVVTLDVGLDEDTRNAFDGSWPVFQDSRPWEQVYRLLADEAVSQRLTNELRNIESNMGSHRTKNLSM